MTVTTPSRRALLEAALLGAGSLALGCASRTEAEGRNLASLWFTYGGKNREVLESLVRAFNGSQRKDFIHAVFQGDYFEGLAKLRTALAARVAPALSHVVGEVVPYLSGAGVLEPLDDYPGARELSFIPELGQAKSFRGGDTRALVALPFNRSTPIAYLNGAIFARAGLKAPTTWDELRETARALTVQNADGTTRYGFGCPINWWFWVALVGQAGGEVVEPDGTVSLGGDAGVSAIEFWQTLVQKDRTLKPPPGRDYNAWEQTNQDFLSGRVAMIWTSTAFLKTLEESARFPVVAATLPAKVRHAVPTGGTFWTLLKSAPAAEKQTAWRFLQFMHQTPQAIAWATRTGYMPVTARATEELERRGYYQKHPNDRVAVDQLGVSLPWPWSADLFRIQREVVQPRLESAVLSGQSARTLLDEARRLANRGRK